MSLVERIIEHLRSEADAANARAMDLGHSVETAQRLRREHEKLRRLANMYERWLRDEPPL